ncbi:DNA repair protein complementing XP-C cells homolog [Anopheles marshallii]|uniref:DNA repair protein complementing XP-C cells homolog n=1 Tax=Anopheles marshallii TaxID=1521116 RepID=UPI00237A109C|nr:DNA repair protein complementing XP-C cells homolog [Anopheles marshallii]
MNGVARGKLGKLLRTRKVSGVSKQQNVTNSSEDVESSLSLKELLSEPTKQGAAAEDRHMHEPELSESDTDTSSVGDHLVDPSTINLDETFFTQTLKGEFVTEKKDFDIIKNGEVSELSSESEDVNAITVEEEDQMNQIFTQVSDYDRMLKEVNVCNESLERRRKEIETFQQTQTDDLDVPFRLNKTEDVQAIPCAEDDLDWEHVADQNAQTELVNNFEIIVSSSMPKTKRVLDVNEKLKRLEQEFKRKMFLNTHKTHLLLLLAYGIRINKTVNRGIIQCASELYELIGSSEIAMGETVSLGFIQSVTSHYKTVMKLTKNAPRIINQRDAFECQLAAREVTSRKMLNVILLTLFRFLSVRARLVMNLDVVPKHPPTVKPAPKEKCPIAPSENNNATPRYGNVPLTTTEILKRKPEIQKIFHLSQLDGADEDITSNKKARIDPTTPKPRLGKLISSSSESKGRTSKRSAENVTKGEPKVLKLISSKYFSKKHPKTQTISERENIKMCTGMPNFAKLRKQHLETAGKDDRTTGDISQTSSKSSKYFRKKPSTKQSTVTCDRKSSSNEVTKLAKLRHQSSATASESVKKTEHKYRIPELDTWIECYLEKERRWTVVEAGLGSIDCLDPVIDRILSPPLYAFAWEADGTIVDVSPRYRWRNEQLALKNRVDAKWLQKTLAPYRSRVLDEAHLQEQFEFRQLKLRAPRPTTIAQCKNHPSYCLHRHLQKFQAIYPADAPPLGFVQGEPLYARECVHTLHSREVWLRHAKVIRHYEQPYKIVRTKLKRQPADLELFGYWQTEEYIPPEPVNGIVPRNAYGNIEIFKECMLPKGTVHLKHYGLSHICRKLGIDYAVAVVGFGVHAGGNHPIFEGIVICEEHRDRLLEAWQRHQDEAAQKKIEKKQNTVLKNWVKLVKGLLVRRRLKHKYNFEGM